MWIGFLLQILAPVISWIVKKILERILKMDPKLRAEHSDRLFKIVERIKARREVTREDRKELSEMLCELGGPCTKVD